MQAFARNLLFVISFPLGRENSLLFFSFFSAFRCCIKFQVVPQKHNEVFSHSLEVVLVENSAGAVGWILKGIVPVIQGCLNPEPASRQRWDAERSARFWVSFSWEVFSVAGHFWCCGLLFWLGFFASVNPWISVCCPSGRAPL